MNEIVADIATRTPAVIEQVQSAIPTGFPAQIADAILSGVHTSSERLRTEWTERDKI